jgi:hypothetical protein
MHTRFRKVKTERKKPMVRPVCRWEDNIEIKGKIIPLQFSVFCQITHPLSTSIVGTFCIQWGDLHDQDILHAWDSYGLHT